MLTVAEALERILTAVQPLPPRPLPLAEALGGRLARPLVAQEDQPSFASSAMDGYALGPPRDPPGWTLVGRVAAGEVPQFGLQAGQCARIFTGAQLPAGSWAVVPQEEAQLQADRLQASVPPSPGQHIRPAGEHFSQGSELIPTGTDLHPGTLGLAALMGYGEVHCAPRPRVAILSTGDELVEPGSPLGPAQVRNSNAHALEAQIALAGGRPRRCPIVPDDPAALRSCLEQLLPEVDLIVTAAGASVGEHDFVQPVLQQLGASTQLWTVAMRPGKPLGFSRLPGDLPVLSLPGNPVSCFVTFELFGRPLLDRLRGGPGRGLARRSMKLAEPVRKKVGLRFFHRCCWNARGEVSLAGGAAGQASHLFRSILDSQGLVELPEGLAALEPGTDVEVRPWPWVESPPIGL